MHVNAELPHGPGRYTAVSPGEKHYLPGAGWDKSVLTGWGPYGKGALGMLVLILSQPCGLSGSFATTAANIISTHPPYSTAVKWFLAASSYHNP